MMREEVCIVLNERESAKAKAAEALQTQLNEHNITASRVKIDKNVEEIVHTRDPKILVLDYLIGDYSTGLDILGSFSTEDAAHQPKVIFLTDEPSVPVAVEAMRLGAVNYFEIDHPQAISCTVKCILEILRSQRVDLKNPPPERRGLSSLVANAAASRRLIDQALVLAHKPAPVIVVCGKAGAGLSTLSRAIITDKLRDSHLITLDLRTFDGALEKVCGLDSRSHGGLKLGRNLCVFVEHLEEDDGELLALVSAKFRELESVSADAFLIAACCSDNTAAAWQRLASAERLNIPPLAERCEDIPALTQLFLQEAARFLEKSVKPFDPETMTWLSGLDWQDEIRELKAVVTNAAVQSTFSKEKSRALIAEAREIWKLDRSASSQQPLDPYLAAATLQRCDHNYRIAAARLGCTSARLRAALMPGPDSAPSLESDPAGHEQEL